MTLKNNTWNIDVILSDVHIPYYDNRMIKYILNFIKNNFKKIDTVYLNGDIIDFVQLSKFNNDPTRINDLQEDINILINFLKILKNKLKPKKTVYITGNHEKRLHSYILRNSKELYNLDSLSLDTLFKLKELNIELIDLPGKESYVKTNYDVYIGHFNKYSKLAGKAAQMISKERSCNIIQGHTHKIGSSMFTTIDGKIIESYETGCLCDIDKTLYTINPDWQLGFGIIYYKLNAGKIFFYKQFLIKKIGKKYKVI